MPKDNKIKRSGYVSEIDQFLKDFDKNTQQFCEERIREVKKAREIAKKRDLA